MKLLVKNQKSSKSCFNKIPCTKKHETGDAIKPKSSKSHFNEIRGTEKHKTVGEKAKK